MTPSGFTTVLAGKDYRKSDYDISTGLFFSKAKKKFGTLQVLQKQTRV